MNLREELTKYEIWSKQIPWEELINMTDMELIDKYVDFVNFNDLKETVK